MKMKIFDNDYITNKAYKLFYLLRSKNLIIQLSFDFDNKVIIFTGDWKHIVTFEVLIKFRPKYIVKHMSIGSNRLR